MIKISFMSIFSVTFLFISFLGFAFAEESQETRLTQFDVFLSESDFTTQGPNHNILALNKGNSTEINIHVKNNDDVPHKVKLSSPRNSDSSTFSQFEFEPKEILVLPNKTNSTKLYLTVSNQTTTHSTFVTFLGQSETFGMKGLGFYVVVDGGFQWVDYSLRAGLPGSAFPNLVTNISEKEAGKLIKNGLGTPEYLPNGYRFRGVINGDENQLFVYSESPISNQTESIEFWREDGIIVFYSVVGPNVNNTKSLPFKVAQDEGQQIMINGFSGMVTEQTSRTVMGSDFTYKVPADLYFFDDDKKFSVSVKGNLSLEEILKIASSIPRFDLDEGLIHSIIIPPDMKEKSYDEFMAWCMPYYDDKCIELEQKRIPVIMPPLKQFNSGLSFDAIECKENLMLIQKYDGSPACVKSETKMKLVERGWTNSKQSPLYSESELHESKDKTSEVVNVDIFPGSSSPEQEENVSPQTIKIVIGVNNTVRWNNIDDTPHTLTPDYIYDGFESGTELMLPRESFEITFEKPGIYSYHGEPGPWITGTVLVLPENYDIDSLPSSGKYEFERLHMTNACSKEPSFCSGVLKNKTQIMIQCDFPIHGCGVLSFDDYTTDDKTVEWKKYITVSASRIDESLLPDMLNVQHAKNLPENPILTKIIDGAEGCKNETEMCALPSGISIDRRNPLGIRVSEHDDYTVTLDKEQANLLISQLEWTIKENWIYSVLESQQKYYFVVLSTFDNVRTPDVKMRLIDTSSNPVNMEAGEILNYTIQLETWATYGPPARIDLRAVQDAKDSGIKVWIEPDELEIPERSNATATLFVQAQDDAKDGIYDVRVIGHANGNLADLYCSRTNCPTINIGDSAWSISTFGSGSGRGIGGIETPENTWLELNLNKKELLDGEIAEIKAFLVNNSTEKITFAPRELLISVIKTEPVGYYENLYGIEARYESEEPITFEPKSKTMLVRPFYWNQITFHNFEEEQRLDPKQYKMISKFVGASYDWSDEEWLEIK